MPVVDMNMEDVNDRFCLYVFCLQRSLSRSKKRVYLFYYAAHRHAVLDVNPRLFEAGGTLSSVSLGR